AVVVTLADSLGGVKGTASAVGSNQQYYVRFTGQTIDGGDRVTVTINGGLTNDVPTSPLVATVDLAGQQVTGSGPANTTLTGVAGRIDGYITQYSTFVWLPIK